MEQNNGPSRPKTAYEQVMEELEKQRLMQQMQAQQNTTAQNTGGLMNQGIFGQLRVGDGLHSGGIMTAEWQRRAYQMDTMVAADKDAAIMSLSKLNQELRQRIEVMEKMLAHPDWRTISSIESLIQGVETQEVYRAGAPFTAKQVFAEVVKGGAVPDVIKLIDREGRQSNAVVTGITVVTGNPEAPVAYYLTNIKMAEMNKKQVITDLVASIIEERVMESIEEK